MLDLSSQHLGDRVRRMIVILDYMGSNTYIHDVWRGTYDPAKRESGHRDICWKHLIIYNIKLSLRTGRNVEIISDEGKLTWCQISHTHFLPEDSEETLVAQSTTEDMCVCVWCCPCLIRLFSTVNTVDRAPSSRTNTLTSSSVSNVWCVMPSKGCLVRLSNKSVKIHKM